MTGASYRVILGYHFLWRTFELLYKEKHIFVPFGKKFFCCFAFFFNEIPVHLVCYSWQVRSTECVGIAIVPFHIFWNLPFSFFFLFLSFFKTLRISIQDFSCEDSVRRFGCHSSFPPNDAFSWLHQWRHGWLGRLDYCLGVDMSWNSHAILNECWLHFG